MKFITGDECGLIKECIYDPKKAPKKDGPITSTAVTTGGIRHINTGEPARRRRGVLGMTWITPREDDQEFASLHMDGTVEVWRKPENNQHNDYQLTQTIDHLFSPDKTAETGATLDPMQRPLGLSCFGAPEKPLLCAVNAASQVAVINPAGNDENNAVVSRFTTFKGDHQRSTKCGIRYPLASTMAVVNNWVAVGGKERDTVLWDLVTSQAVWKAKNLPPNAQTLLAPQVWPTSILFLNQEQSSSSSSSSSNNNIMAVGSAHAEVRIYDIRVGGVRRPQSATPDGLLEHRVTALCQLDEHRIVAGDAAGFVHAVDLRLLKQKKRVRGSIYDEVGSHGRYVGPTGSVQQLVRHGALLGAIGLDRMLRVFDGRTKKELSCFYLKQRLKAVLVASTSRQEDADDDQDDNSNADSENDADDDGDLDQEDVVDDYVDSDDDDEEEAAEDGPSSADDSSSDSDDDDKGGAKPSKRRKRQ